MFSANVSSKGRETFPLAVSRLCSESLGVSLTAQQQDRIAERLQRETINDRSIDQRAGARSGSLVLPPSLAPFVLPSAAEEKLGSDSFTLEAVCLTERCSATVFLGWLQMLPGRMQGGAAPPAPARRRERETPIQGPQGVT